jgi:hypothetical protein
MNIFVNSGLSEQNKLLHIFTPNSKYSRLLRPYSGYIIEISKIQQSVEYKKTGIGGRSKP